MDSVGKNVISTAFQKSLSGALERLRMTVISEFEAALRDSSAMHNAAVNSKTIAQAKNHRVNILAPSTLVEPKGRPRSRSPPLLGSPKDAEQDAMLAVEDSPAEHSVVRVVSEDSCRDRPTWHTVNSVTSSIILQMESAEASGKCSQNAEADEVCHKKSKKKVAMEEMPSTAADIERILSNTSSYESGPEVSRIVKEMAESSSCESFVLPRVECHALDCFESVELDQPFLRVSPFWMKLFEDGLNMAPLSTIGDDMRVMESMTKDISRYTPPPGSETVNSNRRETNWTVSDRRSIAQFNEKLNLSDDSSIPVFEFLRPLVIPPDAKSRIIWSFLSLLFLAYDGIMIPIDECFRIDDEESTLRFLQWVIQIFWSTDILVSFVSAYTKDGYLERNPTAIAKHYLKTWFLFDVCLVSLEWVMLSVENLGGASYVSLLRNFRAFRIFRMVRLLRFARLWKMMPFIKRFFALSSQGVGASMLLSGVVIMCFLFAHVGACVWHLIGDSLDGGWVSSNHMQNYSVARRYSISLHYMFIRLQGSSSYLIVVSEPTEVVVDTFLLFFSLLMTSVLLSVVAQALVAWIQSDVAQVRKLARMYLKRHRIQPENMKRVRNYLQANQMHGPGEQLMGESKFLAALPANLQEEILFESRRSIMCQTSVFSLIVVFSSRCVRASCQKAVSDVLAVEGEPVFKKGDENLGEMYFLRAGKLWYMCDEDILRDTPRPLQCQREAAKTEGCDVLRRGAVISEVALFVNHWQHVGDLTPERDSILLALQVSKFIEIVYSYRIASICALKYARHFVWALNRSVRCDLSGFDFTVERLDESLITGTAEDHFAFISHYKVEAGTEATLLRDLMEQKIREEPNNDAADFLSPIFVDSEDLVDLARLEQHVIGSSNLVILLTPGILTRPWCLLEIVSALQNGVQLVPVEIQRPGMKYNYPNDEWYEQFRKGEILAPADEELLRAEGHSLESVGEAMRQVFKKISLPFSPHKSGNVRKAEIEDIMKRCHSQYDAQQTYSSRGSVFEQNLRVHSYPTSESSSHSYLARKPKRRTRNGTL